MGKKKDFIERKKYMVKQQLSNIADEINLGNIIVVEPKEDTPILVNGIKMLLNDDKKLTELARRMRFY